VIVDISELHTTLGLADTSADAPLLRIAHRRAERLIKDYVGYEVEQNTFTEYHPAARGPADDYFTELRRPLQQYLILRNVPVRSITGIDVDTAGAWTGTYLSLAAGQWRLEGTDPTKCRTGILYRYNDLWPSAANSTRVVYVGGWSADELDDEASVFKMAVYHAAAKFFNELKANRPALTTAGTGAVASEQMDGQVITYARAAENHGFMNALPPSVLKMLEGWQHLGRAFG